MTSFQRFIASFLIVCITAMGLPVSAQAGIVPTDEALSSEAAAANRDKVTTFLARDDVRKAIEAQGVSAAAATDRVKAMTDAEVAQLAHRVDQAPAAAGDILGILFTVFIILLVTDILGLTKVFPFTRAVR